MVLDEISGGLDATRLPLVDGPALEDRPAAEAVTDARARHFEALATPSSTPATGRRV
jgi:hypothetical protein